MEIKYKRKQKDEEDITRKVKAVIAEIGGHIVVHLKDDKTHIGFFTLGGFYPMNYPKDKYRLVSVWKSLDPNALTWFKVFRKKEVSSGTVPK